MQRTRRYAVLKVQSFLLRYKSYSFPEVHFRTDTIGASPALIACKTTKSFKLLYSPTQRGPTLVVDDLYAMRTWPLFSPCEAHV